MKLFVAVLLLIYTSAGQSQNKEGKVLADEISELKPPFNTQGEQEDYWAQELFKKEYKKKYYLKYIGEISKKGNKIKFGKIQYIELFDFNPKYNLIFEKGIFYPNLLGSISLKIGSLEELKFLSNNPKVKRFRFWLYRPNMANPQVYFFELINAKANKETDLKSFIIGAKLTFIKDGWIII